MECPTSIAGIAANAAASLSREITLISGCLELCSLEPWESTFMILYIAYSLTFFVGSAVEATALRYQIRLNQGSPLL